MFIIFYYSPKKVMLKGDHLQIKKKNNSWEKYSFITCIYVISIKLSLFFSDYEIVVVTGDKLNAGTDSKVYVTIYGKTGATKKILLKSTKNRKPFQQGDSDLFKIHDNCVGPLTKVKVEHDNTGFCPGWFLERVSRQTVLRQSCPKDHFSEEKKTDETIYLQRPLIENTTFLNYHLFKGTTSFWLKSHVWKAHISFLKIWSVWKDDLIFVPVYQI